MERANVIALFYLTSHQDIFKKRLSKLKNFAIILIESAFNECSHEQLGAFHLGFKAMSQTRSASGRNAKHKGI